MKYTCPAGHVSGWKKCAKCADMIAAAKVELSKRMRETRGNKSNLPRRPHPNETGKRYGRLLVIRRHSMVGQASCVEWLCECDCGKEKIASGPLLRRGHIKSCGCLQIESRKRPKPVKPLTEADKARLKAVSDRLNAKALELARRVA